jgi:hypothetical protein
MVVAPAKADSAKKHRHVQRTAQVLHEASIAGRGLPTVKTPTGKLQALMAAKAPTVSGLRVSLRRGTGLASHRRLFDAVCE